MVEESSVNKLSADNADDETGLQKRDDDAALAETKTDDETDETQQIRDQIVETRREMSETIDAIQEKLSFSNISEQVKDQVSEQINSAVETAKDAFYDKAGDVAKAVGVGLQEIGDSDLVKKAQKNPTALSIIGAGIGALLVGALVKGKKSKRVSHRAVDENYDYDFDYGNEVRYSDNSRRELMSSESDGSSESAIRTARQKFGDAASSAYEKASDTAGSAYETVAGAASSAYETVGGAASKTYQGVGSVAGKTYQGLNTAAGYAYEKAGDMGEQVKINYDYYIEENPLVVGAVAFAVGAAIGYAIPLTQKENEYLGEYRDNVLEKAQATAQEAIGSVKQMASDAQKIIAEEVKTKTA